MSAVRFNDFELIPQTRRLLHAGSDVAISVRVFEVIAYLVENRERAVGRDELLSAVWGRVDGGDAALAQAVLKARRALGDDGNAQNYIRTVARFGYQWVAPTSELPPAPVADSPLPVTAVEMADPATDIPPHAANDAPLAPPRARFSPRIVWAGVASIVLLAAVLVGVFMLPRTPSESPPGPARTAARGTVPGLILVTPTRVKGLDPDDGWMRLGVMALSTQALNGVPGHAVVPDETALAAVARAGARASIEQLRAATGAAIVISSEASRIGEDWRLDATVFNADGSAQLVNAKAGDAVAAATMLARNLRELLAPEGAGETGETIPAAELSLAAHMKAAILEAQNGRAIALLEKAPKELAEAPRIVLLEAEALTQLGKPEKSIDALHPLVDRALAASPAPHWLPDAWTALGDAELARGRPAEAEAYFRRAIQLQSIADRRSVGLAWRGLGISQIVRNDLDGAEQSYLRARLELEPVGDRLLLARITDGLGYIATTHGRIADALMLYEQAATMGAAVGLNETELGSRLNAAQAREALLQHTRALADLRELLPRIRALDYPALHRFGSVSYANALVETGALDEARSELARLAASPTAAAKTDAVVDVRLDEAGIDLALGDAAAAKRLADSVLHGHDAQTAPDNRLEAAVALLNAAVLADDRHAGAALVADEALWNEKNVRTPAQVHALIAKADWAARTGDAADAIDRYQRAFAMARDFGMPLLLREAALPYAKFQLGAGAYEAARSTASALGPYAEDDFEISLLMARVASATRQGDLARSYFAQARRLAGQRWTQALADEAAVGTGVESPARGPLTRSLAGG